MGTERREEMMTLTDENTLRTTIELLTTLMRGESSLIKQAYLAETRERLNMIELEYQE